MELNRLTILLIFIGFQTHLTLSRSDQLNLTVCSVNRTVSLQISTGPNDMNCACKCDQSPDRSLIRDDYIHTPGIGSHKLHKHAATWNTARKICYEENAHLAIINSKAEEELLIGILRRGKDQIVNAALKDQALLGIHDQFKEGEWLTIFGEPLSKTGFAGWSNDWYGSKQPDNYQIQNCGALCLPGGLDDVNCNERLAFFCELPVSC